MFQLASLPWSPWLLLASVIGSLVGVLVCLLFPLIWKDAKYRFTPTVGAVSGVIAGSIVGAFLRNPLVVLVVGSLFGYLGSRLFASLGSALVASIASNRETGTSQAVDSSLSPETATARVPFRRDWDARPRYGAEEEEEGVFVGRREVLERLTSDFISKRSGTILISGVRGVGKTALVERALLDARNELQNRYWKTVFPMLEKAPFWCPIDHRVLEELPSVADRADAVRAPDENYLTRKAAAAKYAKRPARWFLRFSPTDRLIRRLHRASRSQLFVLKFNASDIGGAMAEPSQNAASGRPNVNPEKLLRALIRKLFMTCHSSRRTIEAEILRWSLRNQKERKQFFDTLQNAYDKSVSKSYKEIISNSVNEAIKRSQSSSSERKINLEKVLGLLACLAIGGAVSWLGWKQGWKPLQWLTAGGGAAVVATYFTWTRTSKSSRETLFDRARQAQFSYEYDYSLARMEYDLEAIFGTLREPRQGPFDRNRCFTRKVIIFDELDKLKNPIKQLNDVITHFKNFFTLSDALFVFITDHEFYEHLSVESTKAQLKRHYSEEHTFFTQKLYLRKPDFEHFNETVYRFCDVERLQSRVRTVSLDEDLIEFLRRENAKFPEKLEGWVELENLTHLYINREKYAPYAKEIEEAFESRGGFKDPLTLARVWAATVPAGPKIDLKEKKKIEEAFDQCNGRSNALAVAEIWGAHAAAGRAVTDWRREFVTTAKGWESPEAVAFLYRRRHRFSKSERQLISDKYKGFDNDVMGKYTGVDKIPFTLSDLARALCFQTRNHYFDLYHLIYDYVGSYADGLPLIHMGEERFTREHRLWSRYQQLVQAAFKHRQEDHPSREYFNALLMESLYSVFDTRSLGEPVEIKTLLFSPHRMASPQAVAAAPADNPAPKGSPKKTGSTVSKTLVAGRATGNKPSASLDPGLQTTTPREGEQINQAILRLLRIAVARRAIRVEGDFEEKVKSANGKLDAISSLTFTWEPDCEPVITQEGLDLEPHETDLINFWENNQPALEALDRELDKAWDNVEMPNESAARKMRDLYDRLRTTAAGLRRRDITSISHYDASILRAEIGTPETWVPATGHLILERIRAEGDADIADFSTQKEPWASQFLTDLALQQSEIEMAGRLPLRALIRPKNSNCLMYLIVGALPPNLDLNGLQSAIPEKDRYLFWYASGIEASELGAQPVTSAPLKPDLPASLRFYFPPPASDSVSKLLADYGLLASTARLQQMVGTSRTDYKRAGTELIGALTGLPDLITLFSHPDLPMALQSLNELPTLFKANPADFWSSNGVDLNKWSAPEVAVAITNKITSNFQVKPFAFQQAIEKVISQGLSNEASKASASSILSSSSPNANARLLLQELLEQFVSQRVAIAHIEDTHFKERLTREFTPWLLNAIETIATNRKVELIRISSWLSTLAGDLDKQRLALRAT